MNTILVIIAFVLMAVGIIGAIVPMIPGPPLAWAGLFVAFFSVHTHISILCLVITLIVAVVVQLLDTFFPVLMTRKTEGSKSATRGATVGLIVGLIIGPWGILPGPFLGAFVGELLHNSDDVKKAFKVAFGSFIGFLCGTGLKLMTVFAFIWVLIISLR